MLHLAWDWIPFKLSRNCFSERDYFWRTLPRSFSQISTTCLCERMFARGLM
ncbi:hypothetical protein Hanom_Chr03g00258121 [Helianthus anomalus]